MPRRGLRIVSSSDEEDNDVVPPQTEPNRYVEPEVIISDGNAGDDNSIGVGLESVTLNSSNTPQNPPISRQPLSPIPLDISSDEENMSDNVNIPSPNPANSNIPQQVPVFDGSVSGILRRLGLNLRREWLDSCLIGLENAVPGFLSLDNSQKAKLCFEQFLNADMNHCGAGVLPGNLHTLHLHDLKGPFILQVDEIVNISCPLRGRYQKAAPGIKRCLKLSMTDGVHRVFGMEYRPIHALDVFSSAGLKVAICNVNVRRGLLMLVPEAFEVLGGVVEELEAARLRLVQEVNKPPRGKRTRTGVIPPLATRASLAAWPRQNNNDPGHINNSQSDSFLRLHTDEQGSASRAPVSHSAEYIAVSRNQEAETNRLFTAATDGTTSSTPANGSAREDIARSSHNNGRETNSSIAPMDVEEIHMVDGLGLPYILSGDKEVPFTYMASLLAKWAFMKDKVPSVEGRIKCFLTGVKRFHFKERATYELHAFIDDGSLISDILIDHNVVQKQIGYSPQEATAALGPPESNLASEIKLKIKQFQLFLANFEGMMLIKMNNASPLPVAIEMNQGSAASDARLLLERLKSISSAREQQHSHLDPINLSP